MKIIDKIESDRLVITRFTPEMAESVHLVSLDDANRRFMEDEVFESADVAAEVIDELTSGYGDDCSPQVYPILLKDGTHIGHVEAVPIKSGWEIGYHVGEAYSGNGYATEAVGAFLNELKAISDIKQIYGICVCENYASRRVLEKCGFSLEFEGIGKYRGEDRNIRIYVKNFPDGKVYCC